ncbi:hypothetical protein D0T50_00005 [Bacteroides sp. 214]|uniref:hypothetical protein n=1 Tax=Bacteroides sp. 214 TaxID=2302935 RepID=UPI0013D6BB89|nr:hypothetical protein [Bacteroides sp. 214]NDW11272.1 hypothetical protein [Bacteroides sp. 214]
MKTKVLLAAVAVMFSMTLMTSCGGNKSNASTAETTEQVADECCKKDSCEAKCDSTSCCTAEGDSCCHAKADSTPCCKEAAKAE